MPNQREIAARSGLSQSTVSLAMRDSSLIPLETRKHVRAVAASLGYRPNPLVSSLMEHIRSGRQVRDHGCIALLVDAENEADWLSHPNYTQQYEAIVMQAESLGYRSECFFLKTGDTSMSRIDRILEARGIFGVILPAPQKTPLLDLKLRWDRYACITSGYTWASPKIDRVATHYRHHVELTFSKLAARGCLRIGMCLPQAALTQADSIWHAGYLLRQSRTLRENRMPLFVGHPATTPLSAFRNWLEKWKPDAIVCLNGEEWIWLEKLGRQFDVAFACLSRPPDSAFSGIDEANKIIGTMLADITVSHVSHNVRGIPKWPREILIEGHWVDGSSTVTKKRRRAVSKAAK